MSDKPFLPPDPAVQQRRDARDFGLALQALICGRGDPDAARRFLNAQCAPGQIAEIADGIFQRAAVPGFAISENEALAAFNRSAAAWLASAAAFSPFDAAAVDFRPVPLEIVSPAAAIGVAASAGAVAEGQPTSVTAAQMTALPNLEPLKCAAIAVITSELARLSGVSDFISAEVLNSVVKSVNAAFLSQLIEATSPTSSTRDPGQDLAALLAAIDYGADASLYLVLEKSAVKSASMAVGSSGNRLFPALGPLGGMIVPGVRCMPCESLASGTGVLFDAKSIVGNAGNVVIDVSTRAALEMASDPTVAVAGGSPSIPTGTTLVSMFQSGASAVRTVRWFSFKLLRAAASLSGVSYVGGSP